MSDPRREVIADTLMDCRADWGGYAAGTTYQEGMRRLADIIIRELDTGTHPTPAAPSPALTREALAAYLTDCLKAEEATREGNARTIAGQVAFLVGWLTNNAPLNILAALGTPLPAGLFRGTVFDAGGGEVRILVDRDTPFYPDRGDRLTFLSETPAPTSTREETP